MNGPFVVAQASSNSGQPVQTIKLTKPPAGQTETFHASFTGTVKIDFTGIADQKITLYHDNANQTLHVIFADGSQDIIEPFFDSTGNILANLIIEVGANQDLDGAQFASQFPITEDQSVLPAAGGTGNASGADFHSPTVDPLAVGTPLPLLLPEELPPVNFLQEEAPQIAQINLIPVVSGTVVGIVEEEALNQETVIQPTEAGIGNEDTHDATGNPNIPGSGLDKDTSDTGPGSQITTNITNGTLAPLVTNFDPPMTFGANSAIDGTVVKDSSGHNVTSIHEDVTYLFVDSSTIEGVTNGEEGQRLIFTLHVNTDGSFTFTLNDQIDHPVHSDDNSTTNPNHIPGIFEETLYLDLSGAVTAHDATPDTVVFPTDTFEVGVIDDTPIANDSVPTYYEPITDGSGTTFITVSGLDDENQPNGIEGGPGDDGYGTSVSGTLNFSPGADNYNTVFFSTNLAVIATDGVHSETFDQLQAIYVDANGLAHTENVTLAWTADSAGGGTLLGTMDTGADGVKDVFTLTVDKFGHYDFSLSAPLSHPFTADPNVEGSTEFEDNLNLQFTYSVTDGDGDQADAHLTINVDDDVPTATDTSGTFVDDVFTPFVVNDEDATLNTGFTGNPGGLGDVPDATNTVSGTLNFASGADGIGDLTFASLDNTAAPFKAIYASGIEGVQETVTYHWDESTHTLTAVGDTSDNTVFTLTIDDLSTGHFTFELDSPLAQSPGGNENNIALELPFTITDGDGDQATANLTIEVNDDTPTLSLTMTSSTYVVQDETPGVQSADGATDVSGTTSITFDGNSTTVAALFSGIGHKGSDPNVSHDVGGAIGYAAGTNGLADVTVSYGADGAATSNAEVFSLTLPADHTDSGLQTTDGHEIYLFNEGGIIVGRYDGPDPGTGVTNTGTDPAAFAVTIDSTTGEVYVAQYVSLHNPDAATAGDGYDSYNEPVRLNSGTLILSVSATDGDGDTVTQAADVSNEVLFLDDGPTVSVTEDRHFSVVLDETPGLQSFPFGFGDDNDQPFFILPSEVKSAFDSVANTGNDPDVSPFAKDYDDHGRGAINFAWNFFTPALDVNAVFGADGPAAHNSEAFSLTLNGTSGQVDSGIQTTEGKEIYLTLENGVIVGRVDTNGDHQVSTNDPAAFAITIDDSGHVATAEWLSLYQNSADPNGDIDEAVSLASGTVSATVTVTDGDGDQASASADISNQILFEDDGPTVDVSQAETGEGRHQHDVTLSGLTLDESIGPNTPSDPNAHNDDNGSVTTPSFITTPDSTLAIGILSTPTSANGTSVADLFNVNINYGADGPKGNPVYTYSLVLTDGQGNAVSAGSSEGVETNLVATDLFGSPYVGTTDAQRTIYLFHEADGSIVGRVGDDPNGDVALHIVITGSASDPQITVEQYVPIEHPNTGNPDDSQSLTFDDHDASLGINLAVTATDGDNDSATDSKTITLADHHNSFVSIQDDGPSITSFYSSGTVVQDETPGVQDAADPNPANDVTGADLPTGVLTLFNDIVNHGTDTDVSPGLLDNGALGFATSASPLVHVGVNFGTDGPALSNSEVLSLSINGGNNADSGLQTTDGHHILLELETYNGENLIVGRVDGDGNGQVSTADPAAFAIELGQDGNISVAQYLSLKNPIPGSTPADYDEPTTGLQNIQATAMVTDGDGDQTSQTIDISSSIAFQDDGPSVTVSAADFVHNSFFFDGFVTNGNEWGNGSGVATGTSGDWTISDANVGHSGADLLPNTGSGAIQLERVGDGYDGGTGTPMHTSTNGFMVDMDASPHDVEISQVINGLTNGVTYLLNFEAGAPIPSEAHLEVWFGDQKVFDLDPTNTIQSYSVELVGGSGDGSNLLEFRETGTPDNHGTYLANITMGDAIVVDETPGIQPDSNETNDPGVIGLFAGVANPGVDPDMPTQYATGSTAVVSFAANFGADGPLNGNAVTAAAYSLNTTNGIDSGLKTTDGHEIYLFKEGSLIVGRYDGDNSGTVTDGFDNTTHNSDGSFVDPAAFALAMNSTGEVSVALFVSLNQPDQATFANGFNSYDEGVYLNSGTVSATVTVTDGDGDTASQSADISKVVRFEDDGPTVSGVTYDQHGSNLIVNGSFEDGHPQLGGSDWDIYTAIPGWTDGADGIPFEVQTGGVGGINAEDGKALIELDGDFQGNGHGTATPNPLHTDATIQQTIATTAGEDYVLTFWYSPRPDHSGGTDGAPNNDSGLNVLWNGVVIDSIDSTNLPSGWQQITLHVTGTGDDVLAFQGTGPEDEFGALIDNVSLNSVNPTLDDEDTTLNGVGVQGGPGDDGSGVVATGQIHFDAGADGLKQIEVSAPTTALKAIFVDGNGIGHPEDVSYHWVADGSGGGTLTGSTTDLPTAFTLTVDNTGHFTFTLVAPLDHPGTDDPSTPAIETSFEDNLLLGFGFTVTDGDGDQATGTITINVDDDSPVANNDIVSGTVSGTVVIDVLANDHPGADGINAVNGVALVSGPSHGSVTENADHTFSYTPDSGYSGTDSFVYSLTDGDGDMTTATVTINDDTIITTASIVTAPQTLDDEAQTLFPANFGGAGDVFPDLSTVSGNAGALFSTSAFKSLDFTPPLGLMAIYKLANGLAGPETLSYHTETHATDIGVAPGDTLYYASGNTSGNTVFTLLVHSDGSYTFTQDAPLVSGTPTSVTGSLGTQPATEENLGVIIGFTVTDTDNGQATGSLTVNVNDDQPTIGAIQDAILAYINNTDITGTWQPQFGADGPNAADAISVQVVNGTVSSSAGGLTYVVNDTHTTHGAGGPEVYEVDVKSGTALQYQFWEYSSFDPATQSTEMHAFTNSSLSTAFFELAVNANGTYSFHVDTNLLLTPESFDSTDNNSGNKDYVKVDAHGNASFANDPVVAPSSSFPLIIDGFTAADINPTDHKVNVSNQGMGVDSNNLGTGDTLTFTFFSQQSEVDIGVNKSNNATTEHFTVQLYDQSHNLLATEDISQPDGQLLKIDSADWHGTGVNAFQSFYEVDVTNAASASGDDDKLTLTTVQYGADVAVGSTALNFALTTTDGDGDSFTSSDPLTISLVNPHDLTGLDNNPEVIAAISGTASLSGGLGGGDTVDYENSNAGVNVDLATDVTSGGYASHDSITGFENAFGSDFNDTLTAATGGSILYGGGGADTLNGGLGDDTLIGGFGDGAVDTLTGGGGNDKFVLDGHSSALNVPAGGTDIITDFDVSGTDSLFVDVADKALTIGTAQAISNGQFTWSGATGGTENDASAWSESGSTDKFFYNAGTHDLWYSANGTGNDKIDLAHMATGVPVAADVHTF